MKNGIISMRTGKLFLASALLSSLWTVMVVSAKELSGPDVATQVSRYGRIVDKKPVGAGGLTAWTVEQAGRRLVLYSTQDGQALLMGMVWDLPTGRNLSDQFRPAPSKSTPEASSPAAVAALDGKFRGEIPASMRTVDSLAGVKEGTGGIADTLYVIIDPRCPYCRKTYEQLRPYVARGQTVKWIPVAALRDPAESVLLASTLIQSKDKEVLSRVLGRHEPIRSQPTPATEQALKRNLDFMFAAFQANANGGTSSAGVPVAFYLDHRTGAPQMMQGISEPVVLQDILGPATGNGQ